MRRFLAVALGGALTLAAGPAHAQFFEVHPAASFWHTCSDAPTAPAIIPLSDFAAGSTLMLAGSGVFSYTFGSPAVAAPFAAVFSSTNTLLGAEETSRVPGALAAAAPTGTEIASAACYFGGDEMSIPGDFAIFGSAVGAVIPAGAKYLFVGLLDSYFADNSTPDQAGLGVRVTASPVSSVTPEPVSLALLATGLVGLGLARRRWRKQVMRM